MTEASREGGRLLAGLGLAALATAGSVGISRGAYELLLAQARIARRIIPKPTSRPFNGDGIYRPGAAEPEKWRPGIEADLEIMVFGDSLAAGLGAASRAELPGVLLARGVAEESGKRVLLSTKAIVGASSKGLYSQVEAMQIAGGTPDVAVILIGGNDVTAKHGIGSSARRLGEAVRELVDSGAQVVVGTCPDLGVIRPVPQPLRSVMHSWSLRLADAQAAQVRAAGGMPVSLAETLTTELRSRPEALFSADQFHPNSAGYELAAAILLPAVCETLGIWPAEPAESAESAADAPSTGTSSPTSPDAVVTSPLDDDRVRDAQADADPDVTTSNDGHVVEQLLGRLLAFVRRDEGASQTPAVAAVEDDHAPSPFDIPLADSGAPAAGRPAGGPGQGEAKRAAWSFFRRSRFRHPDPVAVDGDDGAADVAGAVASDAAEGDAADDGVDGAAADTASDVDTDTTPADTDR